MSARRESRLLITLLISMIVAALAVPAVLALAGGGASVSGKRLVKKRGEILTIAATGQHKPDDDDDDDEDSDEDSDADEEGSGAADQGTGEEELPVPDVQPTAVPTAPPEFPTGSCSGAKVAPGASLQAAISSSKEGATLCLGAGTYKTSSPIQLKNGIKLIGAGPDATFIVTTSASTVLDAKGRTGVVFQGLDVSGATGSSSCKPACGRGITPGANAVVNNVHVHDNANAGIGGSDGNLLVVNSELSHNGSADFTGCCAGGIKSGNNFTIKDSYVHDNIGVGIWCDVGCDGGSFEVLGNTVENNLMGGIRYELSSLGAVITGNTVRNNNLSNKGGHGGIEINSSKNAIVEGNALGGNKGAGIIANGNRSPGLGNVSIRGNVLNGDRIAGCGGTVACGTNK